MCICDLSNSQDCIYTDAKHIDQFDNQNEDNIKIIPLGGTSTEGIGSAFTLIDIILFSKFWILVGVGRGSQWCSSNILVSCDAASRLEQKWAGSRLSENAPQKTNCLPSPKQMTVLEALLSRSSEHEEDVTGKP